MLIMHNLNLKIFAKIVSICSILDVFFDINHFTNYAIIKNILELSHYDVCLESYVTDVGDI